MQFILKIDQNFPPSHNKFLKKISGPGGISLQVKVNQSENLFVKLEAPPEPSRKPSMQFNGGLVRGLRMVLESRYQSDLEDDLP